MSVEQEEVFPVKTRSHDEVKPEFTLVLWENKAFFQWVGCFFVSATCPTVSHMARIGIPAILFINCMSNLF